jgi:hypothetical protein
MGSEQLSLFGSSDLSRLVADFIDELLRLGRRPSASDWWPGRSNLGRAIVEVEAEAVAYIVATRFGLSGSSAAYVSRFLTGGDLPVGVSLDSIAETMRARRPKPPAKERVNR